MAYVLATTTASGHLVGLSLKTTMFPKATAADACKLTDSPGVLPLSVVTMTNAASGTGVASENWGYATIRAAEPAAGTFTATDTTIEYDTAQASERPAGQFYVLNPTTEEIMYVIADSGYTTTSGTLTVKRGALGTTARTIADNQYLMVMNCLTLAGISTGVCMMVYYDLPDDPGARVFGA